MTQLVPLPPVLQVSIYTHHNKHFLYHEGSCWLDDSVQIVHCIMCLYLIQLMLAYVIFAVSIPPEEGATVTPIAVHPSDYCASSSQVLGQYDWWIQIFALLVLIIPDDILQY